MKTRLLIIIVVITSLFIGLPNSGAFFEEGIVIEVHGQTMELSNKIISPGQTLFVNGTFNQPVDDFTANVFKDYESSRELVLTLAPFSNEFGDFNFNFTIPQDWKLGNYHVVLENGIQEMNWQFIVRNNYAGGSLDDSTYPVPWIIDSPLKQIKNGVALIDVQCKDSLVLIQKYDGSPACVSVETKTRLIERGWAENGSSKISESQQTQSSDAELQVHVTGQQQVRRGTTHDITVDVTRNGYPISDSRVIITIEDYGQDIIREFEGKTDDSGRFVFSWEIPKSFDDIETLLAYVDVTDDISAKTVLFKFQVYCLPGESGCKVDGN